MSVADHKRRCGGWRAVACGMFLLANGVEKTTARGALLSSDFRTPRETVLGAMHRRDLASITSDTGLPDTGAFQPGHRDFTHYTTPGLCLAAAVMTANVLRSTLPTLRSYDTLQYQPDKDTLPRRVSALARQCGARFTLANTPLAQWGSLFDLALLEDDDSLAQTVLAHWVVAAPAAHASLQLEALTLYLGNSVHGLQGAEPARPRLADRLLATIDRDDDLTTKVTAHQTMLWYAVTINDGVRALREVSRLSILTHQGAFSVGNAAFAGLQLQLAYRRLMRLMYFTSPDSMSAVAELAREDLQRFSSDAVCQSWMPGCRTASVAQIGAHLVGTVLQYMSHQAYYWGTLGIGQPVTPLSVAFWFPPSIGGRPSAATRDTVVSTFTTPVTVLILPEQSCQIEPNFLRYATLCRGVVETVRRWAHRFRPTDVSIVIVTKEYGGAFLSGAEPPAAEAERIRWYFQDFQGLPVTVAVQRSTRPPLADGRYLPVSSDKTLFLAAPWPLSGGLQIVDRRGTLVFEDSFMGDETDLPGVSKILGQMTRGDTVRAASTAFSGHP